MRDLTSLVAARDSPMSVPCPPVKMHYTPGRSTRKLRRLADGDFTRDSLRTRAMEKHMKMVRGWSALWAGHASLLAIGTEADTGLYTPPGPADAFLSLPPYPRAVRCF